MRRRFKSRLLRYSLVAGCLVVSFVIVCYILIHDRGRTVSKPEYSEFTGWSSWELVEMHGRNPGDVIWPVGWMESWEFRTSFNLLARARKEIDRSRDILPRNYVLHSKRSHEYWRITAKWMLEAAMQLDGWPTKVLDVGSLYGTMMVYAHFLSGLDKHGEYRKSRVPKDLEINGIDQYHKVVVDKCIPEDIQREFGMTNNVFNIELDDLETEGRAFYHKEYYDLIMLHEVIEHFNFYPIPTLVRIRNLLTPNTGRFYISTRIKSEWTIKRVFEEKSLNDFLMPKEEYREDIRVSGHKYEYNIRDLIEICKASGFVVVDYYADTMGQQIELKRNETKFEWNQRKPKLTEVMPTEEEIIFASTFTFKQLHANRKY